MSMQVKHLKSIFIIHIVTLSGIFSSAVVSIALLFTRSFMPNLYNRIDKKKYMKKRGNRRQLDASMNYKNDHKRG